MENISFEFLTNSVLSIVPFDAKAQTVKPVYHKFKKNQAVKQKLEMLRRDNFLLSRHQFYVDNHEIKDLNHSPLGYLKIDYSQPARSQTESAYFHHYKGVKYGF